MAKPDRLAPRLVAAKVGFEGRICASVAEAAEPQELASNGCCPNVRRTESLPANDNTTHPKIASTTARQRSFSLCERYKGCVGFHASKALLGLRRRDAILR